MARRPRIDLPGYHHIVNRGVNRMDIFSDDRDKEKFLQIVCKSCRIYGVVLHDYCLMDNHYHLLMENSKENLSLVMRQINANYAIYYNKKTKRTGHLWQGRYNSWYILGSDYLYQTIRYIAYNPVEACMVEHIREYPFSLASAVLRGDSVPPCSQHSILIKAYDIERLAHFLDEPMNKDEVHALKNERKKKIVVEDKHIIREEKKELHNYFDKSMSKESRNRAIYEAYMDGHTQLSISKEVGLSDAMISMIVKKFRI